MPVVLGIDAGFAFLGLVVVEGDAVVHAEAIRTQRAQRKRGIRVADDDAERCMYLARRLLAVIEERAPAGAVVELPHGGAQGARANRAMGMATGVVVAVLEAARLPTEWVTSAQAKQAATGRRAASKADVQTAVTRRFRWPRLPSEWPTAEREHIADAAAAVLAARGGTLLRALERVGA